MEGKTRKNLWMSDEMAGWYEKRAKEIGVSQTALMVLAMRFYIDQQDAIKATKEIPGWLAQLQELQAGGYDK